MKWLRAIIRLLGWLRTRSFFSPERMAALAVLLSIAFGIARVAGLRTYVSVLSGTLPEGVAPRLAGFLGALYLVLYFIFVLLVPILLFAALILFGFLRLRRFRPPT